MSAILINEIKNSIQDRGLVFWMFILPLLFTVLFNAIFSNEKVGLANHDVSASIVPGYAVMFSFFIMISMVTVFVKDREKGMVARLASTPLPSYAYLLGKWIPHVAIVMIQTTMLFIFGLMVYNIPFENPMLIGILSIFLSFTTTGLGLALAVSVKTENMGLAITQLVGLGGAILSGLWMPIDLMPDIIQTISNFTLSLFTHYAVALPIGWVPLDLKSILMSTLLFVIIYSIFWTGYTLYYKRVESSMNEFLDNKE
ncbi:ABC transporter permease [Salinibacillus xinjiangensis]|nr:ABC transporter permease [Salinibacillus xinjiangensis]